MASVLSVKKEIEAGQEIEGGDEGSVCTAATGNRKEGRVGKRKRGGPEGPAQPLADGIYTRGRGSQITGGIQ